MKAVVVFHGEGKHWLAGLLKPGFNHVAVLLQHEHQQSWTLIDPGLGTPDVQAVAEADAAERCRAQGWTVFETEIRDLEVTSPFLLNNCVGVVKKFLGIRAPFVLTPFQLYRYLEKHA